MLERISYALAEFLDFLRGCLPERRRARFGDMDYDWEQRVDTTASNVGLFTRLRGVLVGSQYQPADPELFAQSMSELPIDFHRYTFVDAGSGKGRAILLASGYPFSRVIGIEVLPELHHAAQRNLAKLDAANRRCGEVECRLGDARDFHWPSQPTVLFLFHPFPEWVLDSFLQGLTASLRQFPRKLWIVYHNPILESVLCRYGFVPVKRDVPREVIYTNDFPEPG